MLNNGSPDVTAAFDMLLGEIQSEVACVEDDGAKSLKTHDYEAAKQATALAEKITSLQQKITALRGEWAALQPAGPKPKKEELEVATLPIVKVGKTSTKQDREASSKRNAGTWAQFVSVYPALEDRLVMHKDLAIKILDSGITVENNASKTTQASQLWQGTRQLAMNNRGKALATTFAKRAPRFDALPDHEQMRLLIIAYRLVPQTLNDGRQAPTESVFKRAALRSL